MTALLPPHVKLNELVTLRCALGIRFRDLATNRVVGSGLRVKATPVDAPAGTLPVKAEANRSGLWLFYGLPSVRTFELGTEELPEHGSPLHKPKFRVEVEDEEGRFLSCSFVAEASQTGPWRLTPPLSPPLDGKDVPLFSAPERTVPPGCAVVRTNLMARTQNLHDHPARWALWQAATTDRHRPTQALGLANKKGDVALMFPWPELVGITGATSPPGGLRIDAQGWELEFAAWHDFNVGDAEFADLDAIFARLGRHPDTLAAQFSAPGQIRATLKYRRELVVPEDSTLSPPASVSDHDSVSHTLIITPAGSPP